MDAAAPEAVEPQEADEPKAEARKRFWRRVKIPTSVVVTLVGIALTAWLLPAFTRQWDDRQKAHEVKTALVTEMAQATAAALTDGRQLLFRPVTGGAYEMWFGTPPAVLQTWSKDSFRIEAELRAHVSDHDAELWHQFSVLVESFLVAASGIGDFQTGLQSTSYYTRVSPEDPRVRLPRVVHNGVVGFDRTISDLTIWAHTRYQATRQIAKQRKAIERMNPELERGYSSPAEKAMTSASERTETYARFAAKLLKMEGQVAGIVLAGHVEGYSTTTRDLIHDLLPL